MLNLFVWIVVCFFSTFGFTYLFLKLSNRKFKKSFLTITLFVIGWVTMAFFMAYNVSLLRLIFFFIFYPLFFYTINPLPFKKNIYYVFVVWSFGMILDLLAMLVISGLHKYFAFNIDSNWNITSLILTFVVFLLLVIIAHFKTVVLFVNKLYERLVKIKYSDGLIIFLMIYIFISAFVILTSLPNLTIDILFALLIVLVIIVFIFLIKYKMYEEEITRYLKILKDNNEFYVTVDDENRIFKHNLIAKLLSVKSVSNKKGMALIDNMIEDFNQSIDFSEYIKVIPYGLNGIVYQKLYPVMDKVDVHITNEIHYDIFNELTHVRYNVLIEKLSIVLDNAIESTLKSKSKIIIINIFDQNNSIVVEVKNSFSTTVDLDSLGTKNYSTKGKRRGLGLFSALRNNEVNLTVKLVNDFFVSKIVAQRK